MVGASSVDINADQGSGFGVSAEPMPAGRVVKVSGISSKMTPPVTSTNSAALSPRLCMELLNYLGMKSIGSTGSGCRFKPITKSVNDVIDVAVTRLKANGGVTPLQTKLLKDVDTLGQSFADIKATVLGPQHMATPEQYATFVALLARAVNLPSRIVTGFRLPPGVTAGELTSSNSYTWAEVYINGAWVVQDPTPSRYGKGKTVSSALPQQENKPVTGSGSDCSPSRTDCNHIIHPYAPRGTGNYFFALLRNVAEGIVVLLLLLALWIAFVAFLKIRRTRRRSRGNVTHRVVGNLLEVLDKRRELGIRPNLTNATTTEIMDVVVSEIATPAVGDETEVRDCINFAQYSNDAPEGVVLGPVQRWSRRSIRLYRKNASWKSKFRSLVTYSRTS